MMDELQQIAPWPTVLADLVEAVSYRAHEGWRVALRRDWPRDEDANGDVIGRGATLVITTCGFDSYHPDRGQNYRLQHFFIVPAATYNRAAWMRWLFEQFAKVELHECMEYFTVNGERPFAPLHGPGCDPYTVHQYSTNDQRRTRFTGELVGE